MVTLSVLKFPNVEGAQSVESTLLAMQEQHTIEVKDAAILLWMPGAKFPKTRHLHSLAEQSILIDVFWDKLLGLIFSLPYLKPDRGSATGKPVGQFAEYGIGDEFIEEARAKVTEGTSALFLLTSSSVMAQIVDAFKGQTFEIIQINLPKAQADKLQVTFGDA